MTKILTRGVYSAPFASRIGDEDYEVEHSTPLPMSGYDPYRDTSVYLTTLIAPSSDLREVWGSVDDSVGVVVDIPERAKAKLRISPRQIVALVVPDEARQIVQKPVRRSLLLSSPEALRANAQKKVRGIEQLFEENNFPNRAIYGTSGDLLWPKLMSHEEIVQMLRGRS